MAEPDRSRPSSALQRFARRARQEAEATQEHCELCSEPIPPRHRHLLEVATREVSCVCQACSILFDMDAASGGRYRLIPTQSRYLKDFQMSDMQWERLRLPVEMAFLFYSTPAERMVAFYPSPLGPTESLLELKTWQELVQDNPPLGDMQRDVEALLINRTRGARQHFLVPIDECYRLVGLIRQHWRGLTGGQEAWQEITRFFEALEARSKVVSA